MTKRKEKPPLKPCPACGAYCDKANTACFGEITAIDEVYFDDDWEWAHACENEKHGR